MGKVCFLCGFRPSKRPHDSPNMRRSLHSLPAREEVRFLWIKACGLEGMVDEHPHLRVCSAHFTNDDYIDPKAKEKGGRSLFLKPNAVPSVSVPQPTTSITNELVLPTVPAEQSNPSDHSTVDDVTPTKRRFAEPCYVNEITLSDFATPRRSRISLALVKSENDKKRMEIKRLHDKNRYIRKRIISLKDVVKQLQQEDLMTEEAGDTLMVHINQLIPLFHNKTNVNH